MSSVHSQTNYTHELKIIFSRFTKEVRDINRSFYHKYYKNSALGMRDTNVMICLPYWLSEAMDCQLPLNTVRALSLGNAYMVAYILIQDRIMDNQRQMIPEEDIPLVMLSSNLLYYKWVKEFQRVFPAHSRFWLFVEKYLAEYSRSTLWEKEKHWRTIADFQEADLKYLGQKFSPAKIAGAGVCLLNHRTEWIPMISELIEQYHIGFQLADDLLDWREDLRDRNYTFLLTKMFKAASATTMTEQEILDHPLARSIAREVLEKSTFHYQNAKDIARQLTCQKLITTLDELIEKNEKRMIKMNLSPSGSIDVSESPLEVDTAVRNNEIHCFRNNGSNFVFDVHRHLMFSLDQPAYDVLQLIDSKKSASSRQVSQLLTTASPSDVLDIVGELLHVGLVQTNNHELEYRATEKETLVSKKNENVICLDLELSGRSRQRGHMTMEIAIKAIDFLFEHSGGYQGELTVFLSCDSLDSDEMNFMTRIIDYANGDQERSQKVRFALNVPLLHANYDVLSRCLMSEVFSSYNFFTNSDDITAFTRRRDAEQFIPLFKERKNIICLVFTPDGDPSRNREATDAWKALGCPIVLIQPAYHQGSAENVQRQKNIVLSDGPDHETLSLNAHLMACRVAKRHAFRFHCNAGKAYLSVSCEGDIYPCARFIGSPDYSLGTVFTDIGTAQARYIERNVQSMDTCRTCWARTICGGGCMFHLHTVSGSINTPDVQWCTSYKEQIEQSISTYYSLPPDRRKRLHEQMQIQQFCDYL